MFTDQLKTMVDKLSGQNLFQSLTNLLRGAVYGETSFVEQITQVLIPIAISLVTIFWLLSFLDKLIKFRDNNFGWEHITMICVQLVIAKYCVQYAPKILDIMATIGDAVSNSIHLGAINELQLNSEALIDSIEKMSTLNRLLTIVQLFIPAFIATLLSLGMYIIVYARGIELLLLGAFSPLPMSTIMFDNVKEIGKRYLQNYLALCLQAGVLMAIIALGSSIMQSIVIGQSANDAKSFGGLFLELIMYYGVMLFAFLKSGSWAQKIVGLG